MSLCNIRDEMILVKWGEKQRKPNTAFTWLCQLYERYSYEARSISLFTLTSTHNIGIFARYHYQSDTCTAYFNALAIYFYHSFFYICAAVVAAAAANVLFLLFLVCDLILISCCRKTVVASCVLSPRIYAHRHTHTRAACLVWVYRLSFSIFFSIILNSALHDSAPQCGIFKLGNEFYVSEMVKLQFRIGYNEFSTHIATFATLCVCVSVCLSIYYWLLGRF